MRTYDPNFKIEALKLVDQIGSSKAAKELNIPLATLYTWMKKAKSGEISGVTPNPQASLSLAEENRRLRQENKELRQTNEILSEATAFFAQRRKK